MILPDCHMHTSFSTDSDAPVRSMIDRACEAGMSSICITDHHDIGFPGEGFILDVDRYFRELKALQEEYSGRIRLRVGIELGLKAGEEDRIRACAAGYDFDYIIGSIHLVENKDPYERGLFDMSDGELYELYFRTAMENLERCSGFQAFGHLDYIVRYGYQKEKEYSYAKYADLIDGILIHLIDRGIALEVNTGGLRCGLGFPNPHPDVLKRYRELGGELITIGSDAHTPDYIGYMFPQVCDLLRECGFRYVTEFINKNPNNTPL